MEEPIDPFFDPRNKRILVIDDDESVREFLSAVIQKEGFQVESAVDGEEALKKISATRYDLIVTDLMLPRYGGFEILRRMQEGATAKIPVVVITGRYTDTSTAEMIRQESNVVAFLDKPIKPSALAISLHRILRTRVQDGPRG